MMKKLREQLDRPVLDRLPRIVRNAGGDDRCVEVAGQAFEECALCTLR